MPDELYVRARAALLDAVAALGPHLEAVVLVGAQAIYIHSGDADLAVAEYTTDADFTISPHDLADEPLLAELGPRGGWPSPLQGMVDVLAVTAAAFQRHYVRIGKLTTGSGSRLCRQSR